MLDHFREEMDKGLIIPWPLLKNFLKTVGPLSYILANHPRSLIDNIPSYKKRLQVHRLPWVHIDHEGSYNATSQVEHYFEQLEPLKPASEKYLRPTRFCESDSPVIRALVKHLRDQYPSDEDFALAAFEWVKNNKYLVFKPMGGALSVFRSKGGVCLDQLSLLAAIARAGGIPARYRLYGLSPTQELYDVLVAPDPILRETFQSLGFLDALHGEAELLIKGRWVNADPTFSDKLSVGLGVSLSELGKEPGWRVRVEKSMDIRFEGFPLFFRQFMTPLFVALRHLVDDVNASLDDLRVKGEKILGEITLDEYREKMRRKLIRPVLPTVEEARAFRQHGTEQPQPLSTD
jgi:hypothetical protein